MKCVWNSVSKDSMTKMLQILRRVLAQELVVYKFLVFKFPIKFKNKKRCHQLVKNFYIFRIRTYFLILIFFNSNFSLSLITFLLVFEFWSGLGTRVNIKRAQKLINICKFYYLIKSFDNCECIERGKMNKHIMDINFLFSLLISALHCC